MDGSSKLTSTDHMRTMQFRDKMAALNKSFLNGLRGWYEQCPHYDFSDTVKSYLEHVRRLDTMYALSSRTGAPPPRHKSSSPAQNPAPTGRVIAKPPTLAQAVQRIALLIQARRRKEMEAAEAKAYRAVSTPAANPPRPSFGNVSAITMDLDTTVKENVNVSLNTTAKANSNTPRTAEPTPAPPASAGPRKRAIRGGGPLGGPETVVWRGADTNKTSAVEQGVSIPQVTITLPKPTPGFWGLKKDDASSATTESNAEEKKAPRFDFGRMSSFETEKEAPKTSLPLGSFKFGAASTDSDSKKDSSPFSGFKFSAPAATSSEDTKKDADTTPASAFGGSTFGKKDEEEKKPSENGSKSALSFPSFGGQSAAPTLAFPSFSKNDSSDVSKPGTAPALNLFGSASGPTPTLTFGATALASKEGEEGGDEEPYQPPKVEVVENTEEGAVISSKCAVFKQSGKEFTKLGVGMLHVLDKDDKKSLLVRAATATGNVWINSLINKMMKIAKADDKGERLRFSFPVTDKEMGMYVIKFPNVATAEKVQTNIEELSK